MTGLARRTVSPSSSIMIAQHPVGRRVLRPHVEDHRVVDVSTSGHGPPVSTSSRVRASIGRSCWAPSSVCASSRRSSGSSSIGALEGILVDDLDELVHGVLGLFAHRGTSLVHRSCIDDLIAGPDLP